MKTISAQEFEKLYGNPTDVGFEPVETKKSFIDTIKERQTKRAEELVAREQAGQGGLSSALQTVGQVASLGGDIIGETINRATGGAIPKVIEAGSKLVPDFVANLGADAVLAYEDWKAANPEQAANVEAATNIVLAAPVGNITKAGTQGVKSAAGATARAVGTAAETVADVARPAIETVGGATRGVAQAATLAAEGLRRIPSRVATNVAERTAAREAIQQLPTKAAQKAVQDGIDIVDVKTLYNIPEAQKSQVKTLVDTVKKYAEGDKTVNPLEAVGKPIVDRVKFLDTQKQKIGKKLGEIADNLGEVSKEETTSGVFDSLKRVSGLQGLELDGGKLNFSNTSLASSLSKSDQKVIQEAFTNATKGGTGKAAHLYRQELFEILGGKKKSLANITDTQERALEAIRKGLSDVLETKNSQYKTASAQYRAVVQPLNDLRKALKADGLDEDLLNLSASLLARRITSNAASNPQIRQILRAMDKVTVKGKTLPNVETLQDIYNVLDRYYNIEGGTTLQGQVGRAVSKSLNARDFITSNVAEMAGVTPAVQRKALEDVLAEILQ